MSSSPSTSDLRRALVELEAIQRNAFIQLRMAIPLAPDRTDSQEWQAFKAYLKTNPEFTAKERRKFFDERRPKRVKTPLAIAGFGDRGSNAILAQRLSELRDVWPESRFAGALDKICFGIIPGGGLDAYAFRVEGRDACCVVIPEGLFYLANLFTKLVVLLQPWTLPGNGLVYFPTASFQQYGLASHPYIAFRTWDALNLMRTLSPGNRGLHCHTFQQSRFRTV
jgi:hypothetical protein